MFAVFDLQQSACVILIHSKLTPDGVQRIRKLLGVFWSLKSLIRKIRIVNYRHLNSYVARIHCFGFQNTDAPSCFASLDEPQHAWRQYRLRGIIRMGMRRKWELHRKYVATQLTASVEGECRRISPARCVECRVFSCACR
jgi:hypothetical protein